MLKKHAFPIILLIIIGLLGTKDLLKPGFYSSHDGEHQLVRQYVFDRAIKSGHIPPRFDRQLYNHLGYPLFTFTYQLPFWIGEAFLGLGLSIPWAIKTTFIITYILSGLTMHLFAVEKWGRTGGFIAAFLYLWAPYRFLTIFVRASLGEQTAFIFLPLLLWALNNISYPKRRIIIGSVSIAGLLLSHSMFAQISLVPLGIFLIARVWQEPKKIRFLVQTLLIGILGVGLSAFYMLPAMYYRSAIQGLNSTFYAEHFVTLKQLIYSKWGYTFSVFGENDGMSFQIGFAQWIAVILASLIILKDSPKKLHRIALALVIGFMVSIFLMMGESSKIWEQAVKKWFVIDLPWRFLAVTTLTSSALAAFVMSSIQKKSVRIMLFTLLILVAVYTNRNHLRINERLDFDHNWFTNYTGTSNSYDEYQPVHTSQDLLKLPPLPPFEVKQGNSKVNILKDQPHRLLLSSNSEQSTKLQLYTVYFPGWQLFIDNQNQPIESVLSQGTPLVSLSAGEHTVDLTYKQTQIMKIANLMSVVSGGIVMGIIAVKRKKSA